MSTNFEVDTYGLIPRRPQKGGFSGRLLNGAGKIVIEKTPDGFTSPDRADAALMAFAPMDSSLDV